jgi:hypothetical protein
MKRNPISSSYKDCDRLFKEDALHAEPLVLSLSAALSPASPALWGAAPPRRLPTSPKEFHPAPQHRIAQAKFLGHRPDRAAARSHKIDRLQLRGFLTATTFHSL